MLQVVHIDVHPDPRVQRVIEQIREAGSLQNLDRVRPIYNHRTLVPMRAGPAIWQARAPPEG